jgi:hypothetical protein
MTINLSLSSLERGTVDLLIGGDFTFNGSPDVYIGEELQSMQEGISGIVRVEDYLNEEEIGDKDASLTAQKLFIPSQSPSFPSITSLSITRMGAN